VLVSCFPSRERLEVGIRVVGTRKRVLARCGHVQWLIKHNIAAPYIPLSGTSERNRHRATIHRRRRNPYPYCLPAKASRPPCGFAVFPPPPSACFFSRHTPLSVFLCYPHQDPLTHACLFPLLFSLAPAPFPFAYLYRSCRVLLARCLRSSSRSRPGKSRVHATNTCTSPRAEHSLLTCPQASIVLRVLFI
jgi:hypothetical protein